LREALNMLVHEEGIEAAWARHKTIAKAIWTAVEVWGNQGAMKLNIVDPAKRSHAVTTINTKDEIVGNLRRWCEQEAGVTLGIGLGIAKPGTPEWDCHFRIGHMGHQNIAMTMAVLGSINTALNALNIEHGLGALDEAAKILASHPLA